MGTLTLFYNCNVYESDRDEFKKIIGFDLKLKTGIEMSGYVGKLFNDRQVCRMTS